jgi:hypothetical protein
VLDEEFEVEADTEVTFVKRVPLLEGQADCSPRPATA